MEMNVRDWARDYPAPAKLNLFLHVVGRRPDGYHLLQTLFHFVDHGDRLRFSPRADGDVVLTQPLPGVPPERDLTVRAARLLQEASGTRQGVEITVDKRLPMGGGLGGGSSDAATVLLALNHLWGLGFSRRQLQAMGLSLGADVPVFVFGRSAFAEGIGEALLPVEVPPAWYVVLEPDIEVPTAAVFSAPELKRDSPVMRPGDWQPGTGGNDLEAVAVARYPLVGDALRSLAAVGPARMSGSGACVFAPFATRAAAEAAYALLAGRWRGWVAAGLSTHPLHALAND